VADSLAEGPAAGDADASANTGAFTSRRTCPSSSCREGALLLGVMTASGRLAYLHPPTQVDADFVARETARGSPERRFRFAGPCVEHHCPQWTGQGCAIADLAAEAVDIGFPASPRQLPACTIRHSCRWYFQRGPAACAACPLIVADMGGSSTYRSSNLEGVQVNATATERPQRSR
jgi:hypothetical protein